MNHTFLRDLQECAYQRLNNLPYFGDVVIFKRHQIYVKDALNKALAGITRKGGRAGVCVVLDMPKVGRDEQEGGAGAQLTTILGIEIIENELINGSANGTRKRADEVAVEVFVSLKGVGWSSTDMSGPLESLGTDPIKAFRGDDTNVHFSVGLQCLWGLTLPNKCADPRGNRVAVNTYELVSATAGAQIYYTMAGDGYPAPDNPSAVLYAEPIVITSNTSLRAIAYKDGWNPSDEALASAELEVVSDTAITDLDGEVITDVNGEPIEAVPTA